MREKNNFSVVILAAGLSERMGMPKMFLKWHNLTFIENIVEGYSKFGCKEIIIVLNERDKLQFENLNLSGRGIITVINEHIDYGRFYSLKLGLSTLSDAGNCFINNVDSPFAELTILSSMSQLVNNDNYVVSVFQKRKGHPVLINKKIVNDILSEKDFSLNINVFLKKYNCSLCNVHTEKIFVNINTIEDLKIFYKIYNET